MKKCFKVVGVCFLVILIALFVLPFVFRGKIQSMVKTEANKNLNAQVEFKDLSLSFIRSFPHVSVALNDFYLVGKGEFEGDTLIAAKQISATVNVKSFFGNAGYEVSKIRMDEGRIHAIIRENGHVNWDIMKEDDSVAKADSASSDFKLSLQQVVANNSSIRYDDEPLKTNLFIQALNLNLSGDMTADNTRIKTSFTADDFIYTMDKIPYISNTKVDADVQLEADWKQMKFTFSDNDIRLNEIRASLDGWIALLEEDGMEMDIRLKAPETQFKDVLSMIPAIYAKDFNNIKTSGKATLDAYAKGLMKGDVVPAFDVNMTVEDATFQYPSLPKSLNQISLVAKITNQGGSADKTIIDISRFHFNLGGNPFDMNLHVSSPVSDPNFAMSAVGNLDLGMIKDVYPLEGMELNGVLDANIKMAARMSSIEKQQYDQVQAEGTLKVADMVMKREGEEDILVRSASFAFSPRYMDLSNCAVQIGQNDLAASGKLENFIPYALKGETLKGTLSFTSNYLNLNDFMTKESTENKEDTTQVGVILIPKNLDFDLTGQVKKMKFDRLDMENVSGQLQVKDGKADMKNLRMDALGGVIDINGYYDTSKDAQQPDVSLGLNIRNVSFAKTFASFETVRKFAPIFESILGNYSTTLNMKSPLGADFMPILASLSANGLLQSNSVEVQDVEVLNVLASTLKNESLKDLKIKNLNLPFSIEGGRVTTKSFDVDFGSGKMNLSGSTGLDQSLNYVAKVDLPESVTKGYVNKVNLKIGGTFKNPKVSLDAMDLLNQGVSKLLGGESGTTLSETTGNEISKQADAIREQASEAGVKLVAEAEKQGENLINEAKKTKNPLLRAGAVIAAETSAKQLKAEAQKKANQLNTEAEKQVNDLEVKAKTQVPK